MADRKRGGYSGSAAAEIKVPNSSGANATQPVGRMADIPDTDAERVRNFIRPRHADGPFGEREPHAYAPVPGCASCEALAALDRLEARLSEAERRAETAECARSHLGELNTVERDRTRRAEARLARIREVAEDCRYSNEFVRTVARAALSGGTDG